MPSNPFSKAMLEDQSQQIVQLSPEALAAVNEGIASARRGEIVTLEQSNLNLENRLQAWRKAKTDAQMQLGKEIDLGIEQIESGHYSEFSAQELPALAEAIKAEGQKRRARRKQ